MSNKEQNSALQQTAVMPSFIIRSVKPTGLQPMGYKRPLCLFLQSLNYLIMYAQGFKI